MGLGGSKMRKTGLIITLCLTMLSCGTTRIIYDNSVHIEDTASVTPYVGIKIVSCDSAVVNWAPGVWKATEAHIPSGNHELSVTLQGVQQGSKRYNGGLFFFNFNFEKGHKYKIQFLQVHNMSEITVIVRDSTSSKKNEVKAHSNILKEMMLNL